MACVIVYIWRLYIACTALNDCSNACESSTEAPPACLHRSPPAQGVYSVCSLEEGRYKAAWEREFKLLWRKAGLQFRCLSGLGPVVCQSRSLSLWRTPAPEAREDAPCTVNPGGGLQFIHASGITAPALNLLRRSALVPHQSKTLLAPRALLDCIAQPWGNEGGRASPARGIRAPCHPDGARSTHNHVHGSRIVY